MIPSPELEKLAWPIDRLGEAVAALGYARGWADAAHGVQVAPHLGSDDPEAALEFELSRTAAHLRLEIEAVETDYAGIRAFLARCAPAVLRLPENLFLPVLERRGKTLHVLCADLKRRRLSLETVREALCRALDDELAADIDTLISAARVQGIRQARARAVLLEELLADRRIRVGWLVRPACTTSLSRQASDYRVRGLLSTLFAAHTLAFLLWLGAWWLLGQGVFSGHLDIGWLQAWALLLLTLLPLRLLASGATGWFAIRAGALLKRRLLAGALRLDPDEIRHLGIGRLLGRILEAEVLEQMAVAGGSLGLTGLVELVMAFGILSLTQDSRPLLVLATWTLAGVGFAVYYLRHQRNWTETRLALTDILVEGMVGHRTRAVQESRERWNAREDHALTSYYQVSLARDRAALNLRAILPRGGLLVGIASLVPAFVAGGGSAVPLALSLGGVLAAYLAFRHLGEGLEQILGAWVAFEQIRPFWRAAAHSEVLGHPEVSGNKTDSDPERPIIEAHNLIYRHAGQSNPVLCGASLHIGADDRVLLEGSSGSGKSTLASLLSGQRLPEAGLCLIGGLDRASLGERAWRRHVALVPQFHENHIFMGSLAFNLLLGRNWPPSQKDIDEADALCRALGLGPLLERMPGGIFQLVGETGWQLSHGERERIYIARALLQGAKVVILDESVSSLDPQTLRDTMALLWKRAPALILVVHV